MVLCNSKGGGILRASFWQVRPLKPSGERGGRGGCVVGRFSTETPYREVLTTAGWGAEMVNVCDVGVSEHGLETLIGKRCFRLVEWLESLRLKLFRLELSTTGGDRLVIAGMTRPERVHDDLTFERDTSERALVTLEDLPSELRDTVESLFSGLDHGDVVRGV